jgi:hypothetical protein
MEGFLYLSLSLYMALLFVLPLPDMPYRWISDFPEADQIKK